PISVRWRASPPERAQNSPSLPYRNDGPPRHIRRCKQSATKNHAHWTAESSSLRAASLPATSETHTTIPANTGQVTIYKSPPPRNRAAPSSRQTDTPRATVSDRAPAPLRSCGIHFQFLPDQEVHHSSIAHSATPRSRPHHAVPEAQRLSNRHRLATRQTS